jgi:type IV secretory pathway VirB10-like protein
MTEVMVPLELLLEAQRRIGALEAENDRLTRRRKSDRERKRAAAQHVSTISAESAEIPANSTVSAESAEIPPDSTVSAESAESAEEAAPDKRPPHPPEIPPAQAHTAPAHEEQPPTEPPKDPEPDPEPKPDPKAEPPEFAQLWTAYPKRAGGNSRADALLSYRAQIKRGTDPAILLGGVLRYRAYCQAAEKLGTEFVMQAATFLGRGRHFEEEWEIPPPEPQKAAQSRRDSRGNALQTIANGRKALEDMP